MNENQNKPNESGLGNQEHDTTQDYLSAISELKKNSVPKEEHDTTQDYLSAISELKKNSVPKEEYAKLREENKQLLKTITDGGYGEQQKPPEVRKDLNELRKELFTKEHNNLDYCTKALELRKECIKQGKEDPFLPTGSRISPTAADIEAANRVAEALEACIENSQGDSAWFTNELMRITKDVPLPRKKA